MAAQVRGNRGITSFFKVSLVSSAKAICDSQEHSWKAARRGGAIILEKVCDGILETNRHQEASGALHVYGESVKQIAEEMQK